MDVKILELELQVKQLTQQALGKEFQKKRLNKIRRGKDCSDWVLEMEFTEMEQESDGSEGIEG